MSVLGFVKVRSLFVVFWCWYIRWWLCSAHWHSNTINHWSGGRIILLARKNLWNKGIVTLLIGEINLFKQCKKCIFVRKLNWKAYQENIEYCYIAIISIKWYNVFYDINVPVGAGRGHGGGGGGGGGGLHQIEKSKKLP